MEFTCGYRNCGRSFKSAQGLGRHRVVHKNGRRRGTPSSYQKLVRKLRSTVDKKILAEAPVMKYCYNCGCRLPESITVRS